MEVLEMLGYGPCYHTIKWVQSQPSDFHKWIEQYEKGGDPELIDVILQGYSSVLDQPAANFPEILYRAYPDAKFALEVLVKHNKRMEELIPTSKLLVYEVEDGWELLTKFLGVPMPDVSFPRSNDTKTFREAINLKEY
ncbi:hypothetical protein M422DRAFT_264367 [Sphaerobolus stellatus SS14]|uniref:Uncharacterized protein n=1 Tax=Sphaerobolus stellatus (strain SS14) TaxID=990650 RepID=A0A0C9V8F8_SPHS4|nr:hypothetical protein M422DRAFT_264367 [Sphaerobolus stellatus SS14]